jgi:hypothetical protein
MLEGSSAMTDNLPRRDLPALLSDVVRITKLLEITSNDFTTLAFLHPVPNRLTWKVEEFCLELQNYMQVYRDGK